MKSHVFLLTAFSSLGSVICAAPAIADDPPVCDVIECSSPDFLIRKSEYACPNSTRINFPIQAMVQCLPRSRHSITCKAYPLEVHGPTCSGSGLNLLYDWTVKVGNVTYPYPPSYDNSLTVSCMPPENVSVDVTVWNGTYSSSSNAGMRCGDSAL